MDPASPIKVFLSYAHQDADFAVRFAKELEAGGASVWMDRRIGIGQGWDQSIERELETCDRFVVILSPASVESNNVRDEINYALNSHKEIYPVLYRDCRMPLRLARLQYLDARGTYHITALLGARAAAGALALRHSLGYWALSLGMAFAATIAAILYFAFLRKALEGPEIIVAGIVAFGFVELGRRLISRFRKRGAKPLLGAVLAAVFLQAAPAAELPIACTPSKPVASNREAIEVTAWAPEDSTFTWTAKEGELDPHGARAIWDLSDLTPGAKTLTVAVARTRSAPQICTATVWVEKPLGTRGDFLPRRFLLAPDAREDRDYGLSSYVLLAPDAGNSEARERNREAIRSWFSLYLPSTVAERTSRKSQLNATYVLVSKDPPDQPDPEWVLKNYDYNRADIWIDALRLKRTGGPYLVSSKSPLAKPAAPPLLVLDGSWAPPSTIRFWLQALWAQSFQQNFDQPRAFDMFNLKLRTIISVFARDVPQALGSIFTMSQ